MAETLGKKGGGCKKELLRIKDVEENLHLEFTYILKKTKEVPNDKMNEIFKSYIEHLYSIVNLIDIGLMK
jgi:hypothetical protein